MWGRWFANPFRQAGPSTGSGLVLGAMMLERGGMVAESVLLIEREEACLFPRRQVTDPQLSHIAQGTVSLPSYVRLPSPGQFFEEWLENILHGVSVQDDTPTVHESVLAGPAPRATYHMYMREGAAPAVAGDSVAVWRDAVRSDEEACPEPVEGAA